MLFYWDRWARQTLAGSIKRRNGRQKSFWSTCLRCPRRRPKPCVRKSGGWQLNLPATKVAEKLHNFGEAGVLVLYPELPQNLHKFPLVIVSKNLLQFTQQHRFFFGREPVFLGHKSRDYIRCFNCLRVSPSTLQESSCARNPGTLLRAIIVLALVFAYPFVQTHALFY